MSYSNSDDDKESSGLLLRKETKYYGSIYLPIYNINDITNDELKILIESFFENDSHENFDKFDISFHGDQKYVGMFVFGDVKYWITLFGEKNDFKKIIIKILNFLKNIMVEIFFCSLYNFYDDHDIIHLIGNVIQNSYVIKEICLPVKYLENDALGILSNYIKNKNSLKYLKFDTVPQKKMPDKCIKYLSYIIKSSNIRDVYCLYGDDYNYFFESLLTNFFRSKISIMMYTHKDLNDDFALKLRNMIIDNNVNYLKDIYLPNNRMTPKGFSIFVDSLLESKNENIEEINMGNNKLDDDCIKDLGKLIKQNKNIKHIDFSNNYITDKGIEKLSEYIVGNTSIIYISLYHNYGITDNSFGLIKNMVNSSTISLFNISKTQINENFKSEIEELLNISVEKREIPLITIGNVKSASKIMKEET